MFIFLGLLLISPNLFCSTDDQAAKRELINNLEIAIRRGDDGDALRNIKFPLFDPNNILSGGSSIFEFAILWNRETLVRKMLETNKCKLNIPRGGYTVLHNALFYKNILILESLLDHGADIFAPNCYQTPFEYAFCQVNDTNYNCCMRLLLDHGVRNKSREEKTGNTVLHVFIKEEIRRAGIHLSCTSMKNLLVHCRPIINYENNAQQTALKLSLQHKFKTHYINRIVDILLENGAKYEDDDLQDPRIGSFHEVKMELFQHIKAKNCNAVAKFENAYFELQDEDGNTPLHHAFLRGPEQFATLVYLRSPEALDIKNKFKCNPIENLLNHPKALRNVIALAYEIQEKVPVKVLLEQVQNTNDQLSKNQNDNQN